MLFTHANPFSVKELKRSQSTTLTSSTSLKKNKLVKIKTIENSVDIFTFDSFSRIHEEAVYRCCEQYNTSVKESREKRRQLGGNKRPYVMNVAQMFSFNE